MRGALVDDEAHRAVLRMGAQVDHGARKARVRHHRHGDEKLAVEVAFGGCAALVGTSDLHEANTNAPAARGVKPSIRLRACAMLRRMWAICAVFSEVVTCGGVARRYNANGPKRPQDLRNRPMRRMRLQSPARCARVPRAAAGAADGTGRGRRDASEWVEGHNSRARLIAGNGIAGVELQLPEGWKTYWRIAGRCRRRAAVIRLVEIGQPRGAQVLYPAPKRFTDRAGDTVGYKGTVVFPVRLKPKDPTKPIDLRLALDYGVCKDICIPAEAELALVVAPDAGRRRPRSSLDALARVPAPAAARRRDDPVLKRVVAELAGRQAAPRAGGGVPRRRRARRCVRRGAGRALCAAAEEDRRRRQGRASPSRSIFPRTSISRRSRTKTLTATLVSDKGQSEATFPFSERTHACAISFVIDPRNHKRGQPMTIKVGDKLPDASFMVMTADGPAKKTTAEVFAGKKVALFAVPGRLYADLPAAAHAGLRRARRRAEGQGHRHHRLHGGQRHLRADAVRQGHGRRRQDPHAGRRQRASSPRRSGSTSICRASASACAPSATPCWSTTASSKCSTSRTRRPQHDKSSAATLCSMIDRSL